MLWELLSQHTGGLHIWRRLQRQMISFILWEQHLKSASFSLHLSPMTSITQVGAEMWHICELILIFFLMISFKIYFCIPQANKIVFFLINL